MEALGKGVIIIHELSKNTPRLPLFTFSFDSITKLENQKHSISNSVALSKISHEVALGQAVNGQKPGF